MSLRSKPHEDTTAKTVAAPSDSTFPPRDTPTHVREGSDFFLTTLAGAMGRQNEVARGYMYQAIDIMMSGAEKDPEIEFVMVLRKGSKTALVGVTNGQPIADRAEFRRIVMRTMMNL